LLVEAVELMVIQVMEEAVELEVSELSQVKH
jgi:hypothetical protein